MLERVTDKQFDEIIWSKWSKGKKAKLKPSGLGWEQNVMPWKAEFKSNVSSNQPFIYKEDGKFISFKPDGLSWVTPKGQVSIKQGVNSVEGGLVDGKIVYDNALGVGISLEMSVDRTTWRKHVVISSLADLGVIPFEAEYLEISFEIETNFDIGGWDRQSELKFTESIWLSELSRIGSIKAWDSYKPTQQEMEDDYDFSQRSDGFLRIKDGRYYLVKQISVEYLKQAVYPVITDTVITYGSEYTFNAAATDVVSVAALDSTHFVVGYPDSGGDGFGHAKIGVVSSGDQIAYGSEYVFNSAATYSSSVAVLDSTHFVVGYPDSGGDDFGHAKIGVVSAGDQIAYGSEYTFNTATTVPVSVAALDSTHFVVGYRDIGDGSLGKAIIGVVSSGDQIAYGSEYTFNAANTPAVSVAALDSAHFVVGYRDFGGDTYGHAKIGVVSAGDQIVYGSEYTFNAANTPVVSVAALDSTHFVVGYEDSGGDGFGHAKIGVVSSGDQIAYGSEYTFNTAGATPISIAVLDSTHFVVGYRDIGDGSLGKAIIGVVSSGDQIAYGSEYTFNAANTPAVSVAALDSDHFVVGYKDFGDGSLGKAKVGVVSALVLPMLKANMAAKLIAAGLI